MIYSETNYVGEEYNLQHPRVLWNSVTRRATLSRSSAAAGFAGENALTATEWDSWKPLALPAFWTLTFDDAEYVSSVGIQSHTFGSSGNTVTILESDDGVNWREIVSASPTDDSPIAFLFKRRSADRLRVRITDGSIPQVSVIVVSDAIEIPQRVYNGAPTPIDLARVTQFSSNVSTGGSYLGRSIRYAKNENSFTVEHLREDWVRDVLDPFIEDARTYPYFLLERPHSNPKALSYRWRDEDITPQRMGIKNLMTVDL